MHTRPRKNLALHLLSGLAASACALALALPVQAQDAATVSVLRVEITGDLPPDSVNAMTTSIGILIRKDERKLKSMSLAKTKQTLLDKSPALAGCETEDCLKRAGAFTGATLGVVALGAGEAQIYDFQITFYDMTTGKTALTEKGSCEICTAKEAEKAFKDTFARALGKVTIPAAVKVEPPKVDPPKVDPPKTNAKKTIVDIVAVPAEANLQLGDLPLGTGTATRELTPGNYTISATAEGFEDMATELIIDDKTKGPIMLRVHLAKKAPAVDGGTGEPVVVEGGGIHEPALGWSLAVLGAVATGGGIYLLGIDGQTTCSEGLITECPTLFETTLPGTALTVGGSAMLTTGIVLIVLDAVTPEDPADPGPERPAVGFGVDPTSGAASVQVSGQF